MYIVVSKCWLSQPNGWIWMVTLYEMKAKICTYIPTQYTPFTCFIFSIVCCWSIAKFPSIAMQRRRSRSRIETYNMMFVTEFNKKQPKFFKESIEWCKIKIYTALASFLFHAPSVWCKQNEHCTHVCTDTLCNRSFVVILFISVVVHQSDASMSRFYLTHLGDQNVYEKHLPNNKHRQNIYISIFACATSAWSLCIHTYHISYE